MPLLFTSLLASHAGAAAEPPEPPFIWTAHLRYRFSASAEVFADDAGLTPASDGGAVARWGNSGSAEDARQADPARRPLWRSGGLGGRPYLACDRSLAQHFEDLDFAQPGGSTDITPFTVFAVTDAITALDQFPALLGAAAGGGGKVSLHVRPSLDEQIHWIKSQVRVGNVANPQLLMAAVGRSADGSTSGPFRRFWMRQNRVDLVTSASLVQNLPSPTIASTEFLRSSGLSGGGYFDGHLYEFLLYEGTLDDATTFAIEDWLMARYGLG